MRVQVGGVRAPQPGCPGPDDCGSYCGYRSRLCTGADEPGRGDNSRRACLQASRRQAQTVSKPCDRDARPRTELGVRWGHCRNQGGPLEGSERDGEVCAPHVPFPPLEVRALPGLREIGKGRGRTDWLTDCLIKGSQSVLITGALCTLQPELLFVMS